MCHLMLDVETLSTATDAAVTQIAVVPFELDGSEVSEPKLNVRVDPQSCMDAGLRVDWSTVQWWMQQGREAQEAALPGPGVGVPLRTALELTEAYFRQFPRDTKLWSNGASFDIPILDNAFRACNMQSPWRYSAARDTRTLAMMALNVVRPAPEVQHDALSDAEAQALWVQAMWKKAGAGIETGPAPGGHGEVLAGRAGEDSNDPPASSGETQQQ